MLLFKLDIYFKDFNKLKIKNLIFKHYYHNHY